MIDRYGKALKDVSSAGLGGGGSVFAGMLGGSRGEVRAECNTLFAGLEACRLNAVKVMTLVFGCFEVVTQPLIR